MPNGEKEKQVVTIARTFEAAFPHVFLSYFQDAVKYNDWKLLWSRNIIDLSEEAIKNGIKKSVMISDFPPSPAQFRKYALDILPAAQAYEAIGSNDLATKAWERIGSWERNNSTEKELKKAFMAKYENLAEQVLLGE